MATTFDIFGSSRKIYGGEWRVVNEVRLDDEDKSLLMPTVTLVKSTWGKSFKFTIRENKGMFYIPADTSLEMPIGSEVSLDRLVIKTLHKDGQEDIQRVMVFLLHHSSNNRRLLE